MRKLHQCKNGDYISVGGLALLWQNARILKPMDIHGDLHFCRRRLGSRSLREGATEPAALDLGATRRQFERRSARPLRGDA